MSERSTESLLRELPRGLEKVRPIPRLRSMLALTLGAFALALLADVLLGHPVPLLAPGVAWGDPVFVAVLAGLLLTAAGGIPAALAGAVPGREGAARWGLGVALLGALMAAGSGLWALARADAAGASPALSASLQCGGRASALGVVPALLLCLFLARAFERRPLLGAGLGATGALALGAVAVHASCADGRALHVLLGHWVTPTAVALVLALPLSLLVRRLSRSG